MGGFAWVTLATNDSYSLGALVLAHSLKINNTAHQLVALITPAVSLPMREQLASVFDLVEVVDVLDSKDDANLALLKRPELGITFTKLHCWRLTQFDKCVFLDADTLVVRNCDELFERDELSAAPDVGWPDCFNSGVFVYKPSVETFTNLVQLAVETGSFDGGDQGLLNQYFSSWATEDIKKHLPFIYNLTSVAVYSYIPAFKQYGAETRIVHFIGTGKPWLQQLDPTTRSVTPTPGSEHLAPLLQRWWDLFCERVHPGMSKDVECASVAVAVSLPVEPVESVESSTSASNDSPAPALPPPFTPYIEKDDSRQINLPYQPFHVKSSSGELLNVSYLLDLESKASEALEEEQEEQEEDKPEAMAEEAAQEYTEEESQPPADPALAEEPPEEMQEETPHHHEEVHSSPNPYHYDSFYPDESCINTYLEQNAMFYQPHEHGYSTEDHAVSTSSTTDNPFGGWAGPSLPRFLTIPEDDQRQSFKPMEVEHWFEPAHQEYNTYKPPDIPHVPPPPPPHFTNSHHQYQHQLPHVDPTPVYNELQKSKSLSNLEQEAEPPVPPVSFWKSQPNVNAPSDTPKKYSMPKLKPLLPRQSSPSMAVESVSVRPKVTQYTELHMTSDHGMPWDKGLGFVEREIIKKSRLKRHKAEIEGRFGALPYTSLAEDVSPAVFQAQPEPQASPYKVHDVPDVSLDDYDLSCCKRQAGNKAQLGSAGEEAARRPSLYSLPVLKPLVPEEEEQELKRSQSAERLKVPPGSGTKVVKKSAGKTKKRTQMSTKPKEQETELTPQNPTGVEAILSRLIGFSKDYQNFLQDPPLVSNGEMQQSNDVESFGLGETQQPKRVPTPGLGEAPQLTKVKTPGLEESQQLTKVKTPGLGESPQLTKVKTPGLGEAPQLTKVKTPGLGEPQQVNKRQTQGLGEEQQVTRAESPGASEGGGGRVASERDKAGAPQLTGRKSPIILINGKTMGEKDKQALKTPEPVANFSQYRTFVQEKTQDSQKGLHGLEEPVPIKAGSEKWQKTFGSGIVVSHALLRQDRNLEPLTKKPAKRVAKLPKEELDVSGNVFSDAADGRLSTNTGDASTGDASIDEIHKLVEEETIVNGCEVTVQNMNGTVDIEQDTSEAEINTSGSTLKDVSSQLGVTFTVARGGTLVQSDVVESTGPRSATAEQLTEDSRLQPMSDVAPREEVNKEKGNANVDEVGVAKTVASFGAPVVPVPTSDGAQNVQEVSSTSEAEQGDIETTVVEEEVCVVENLLIVQESDNLQLNRNIVSGAEKPGADSMEEANVSNTKLHPIPSQASRDLMVSTTSIADTNTEPISLIQLPHISDEMPPLNPDSDTDSIEWNMETESLHSDVDLNANEIQTIIETVEAGADIVEAESNQVQTIIETVEAGADIVGVDSNQVQTIIETVESVADIVGVDSSQAQTIIDTMESVADIVGADSNQMETDTETMQAIQADVVSNWNEDHVHQDAESNLASSEILQTLTQAEMKRRLQQLSESLSNSVAEEKVPEPETSPERYENEVNSSVEVAVDPLDEEAKDDRMMRQITECIQTLALQDKLEETLTPLSYAGAARKETFGKPVATSSPKPIFQTPEPSRMSGAQAMKSRTRQNRSERPKTATVEERCEQPAAKKQTHRIKASKEVGSKQPKNIFELLPPEDTPSPLQSNQSKPRSIRTLSKPRPALPAPSRNTASLTYDEEEAAGTTASSTPDDTAGIAGAIAQLSLSEGGVESSTAQQEYVRRQGWEAGNIDYMGRDSFDHIWSKICETIGQPNPAPEQPPAKPPQ